MPVLNPEVSGGAAFESPVSQPSMLGALAGLVDQGVRSYANTQQSGPAPSDGDEFDALWRAGQDLDVWAGQLDPNNPNYGQRVNEYANWFLRNYPQYGSKVNALIGGPEERLTPFESAQRDFLNTPEGLIAHATAMQTATGEDGTFDDIVYQQSLTGFQAVYTEELAKQSQVDRLASTTTDINTVSNNRWTASSGRFQYETVSLVNSMASVASALVNSEQVTLTDEQIEALASRGVPIQSNTISRSDARFVLGQIRNGLVQSYTSSLAAQYDGQVVAAPQEVMANILAPLDNLIAAIDTDWGSVQGVLDTTQALAQGEIQGELDAAGLGYIATGMNMFSDSVAMQTAFQSHGSVLVDVISDLSTAKQTPANIIETALSDSTANADGKVSATVELLTNADNLTQDQEGKALLELWVNSSRAHPADTMGVGMWRSLQKPAFSTYVDQDPDYREWFSESLASDLQKTKLAALAEIANNPNVQVFFNEDGTLDVQVNPVAGVTDQRPMTQGEIQERIQILEASVMDRFNDYNVKLNVLRGMGDFGSEITQATAQLTNPIGERIASEAKEALGPQVAKPDNATAVVTAQGTEVYTNPSMNPLVTSIDGASVMVHQGANLRLEAVLDGPFQRAQEIFGAGLVINDAIAKDGTSRESETPGSRHFHGDALDISTAGMSDQDKIRLVAALQEAGFQGLGFGKNIIHADMGARRAWAYGNSTFGGVQVTELISQHNSGTQVAPSDLPPSAPTEASNAAVVRQGGEPLDNNAPETDPEEGKPTNFQLVGQTTQTQTQTAAVPGDASGQGDVPFTTVDQEGDNIPTETLRKISDFGLQPGDVKVFQSDSDVQKALDQGLVRSGDRVIVGGRLFLVEDEG